MLKNNNSEREKRSNESTGFRLGSRITDRFASEQDTTTPNVARTKEACSRITARCIKRDDCWEHVMSAKRVAREEEGGFTSGFTSNAQKAARGNSRQEIVISRSARRIRRASVSTITELHPRQMICSSHVSRDIAFIVLVTRHAIIERSRVPIEPTMHHRLLLVLYCARTTLRWKRRK